MAFRCTVLALFLAALIATTHALDVGKKQDAPLGSEDNPHPEDHGLDDLDEEGQEPEETKHSFGYYEDTGEHDKITKQHLQNLHKKMDADGNGKVSREEIVAHHEKTSQEVGYKEIESIFDEIESTQDGSLSLEEHMSEMKEVHAAESPENYKVIEQTELAKFKAADADGDGKLDKKELTHLMRPELHPEVLKVHVKDVMRQKDDDNNGKLHKEEFGDLEHEDFKKLDADNDGHISLEELHHYESGKFKLHNALDSLFESADKDGDKHVTIEELAAAADKLQDGHGAYDQLSEWIFHHEDL